MRVNDGPERTIAFQTPMYSTNQQGEVPLI